MLSLSPMRRPKENGEGVIPISKDFKLALRAWKVEADSSYRKSLFDITSQPQPRTISYGIANKFTGWCRVLGFTGASSHSGRRTAITNWARKIPTVGDKPTRGSEHSALGTTQRPIENDAGAMRRVVKT